MYFRGDVLDSGGQKEFVGVSYYRHSAQIHDMIFWLAIKMHKLYDMFSNPNNLVFPTIVREYRQVVLAALMGNIRRAAADQPDGGR